MCVYIDVCVYIDMCMCMYVYVCVYIYKYFMFSDQESKLQPNSHFLSLVST